MVAFVVPVIGMFVRRRKVENASSISGDAASDSHRQAARCDLSVTCLVLVYYSFLFHINPAHGSIGK